VRTKNGTAYYLIGEVAQAARVSQQTLRVWERQGLLAPKRSDGGQRLYSDADLRTAEEVSRLRRRHGWNPAAIKSRASIAAPARNWAHLSLGMRIRTARRNSRLSVTEAARRMGISPSFLSSVERGESGLSVRNLSRLANALGMPMSAFAPSEPSATKLVRPHERARTVLDGGVTWEELVAPGHSLEPAMLIVPPGASSGGPITRPGGNFVLMMSGELRFDLPDEPHPVELRAGDALMLVAGTTWSWENPGSAEARAVWVEHLLPGAWERDVPAPDGEPG
jgi:transcriptional regulator with XRE-family HTH domain